MSSAWQWLVDVFDTDGVLLKRFASRGVLNSPQGLRGHPMPLGHSAATFWSRISVMVGQSFRLRRDFVVTLYKTKGKPIFADGLWSLTFGGGSNSSSDTLYFTAGPNGETPASDSD